MPSRASGQHQPTSRREQLRAEQAAQAARAGSRRSIILGSAVLAVILIAVVAFAGYGQYRRKQAAQNAQQAAAGNVLVNALTSIPASTFDSIGAGTATQPKTLTESSTQDGKPRILYVGAEFCPYCAMDRLAMVAALNRFGTFSNLKQITSTASDQPTSIPTVSFYGSSYTSKYLVFAPYELEDGDGKTLQTLSDADNAITMKHDADSQGRISFPFIYWGTGYAGTLYDGSDMQFKTHADIANTLKNPDAADTKGIVGAANVLTARICTLTNQQPADVCSSAGVKAAA